MPSKIVVSSTLTEVVDDVITYIEAPLTNGQCGARCG
jgi:hypothetical protein